MFSLLSRSSHQAILKHTVPSPLVVSWNFFHSTPAVFKDKSDMRTKGRAVPKKAFDKPETAKKEKSEDEKAARKAEKALREQMKNETRQAQLNRSNERKTKEDELKKKKEQNQAEALNRMQGTFSHIFSKIDAPVEITPEQEQEDEEINKILEKVESGELDDDDEVVVGGKKKLKKRALNETSEV